MTIKEFYIEYDAINNKNVFTSGDTVNGRIVVRASKDSPIRSLTFFAVGAAYVHFHEDEDQSFSQYEEYYNTMDCIIQESGAGGAPTVIEKGRHIFPFSFTFPDRNLPTSFTSSDGYIRHALQAKLKPFKKQSRPAEVILNFISKTNCDIPRFMEPLHDSKMKTFKFGSGSVLMTTYIDRQGFKQGETLCVTLTVRNSSSRKARPIFALCDEQRFTAEYKLKTESHLIKKKKCKVVKPNRMETVTMVFDIPQNLPPSLLNCSIIKRQYWMMVSLDFVFATNPSILHPIVILPVFHVPISESPPAAAGLESVGSSIPAQRSVERVAPLPEEPPPAYEDCVLDTHWRGAATTGTGANGPAFF